MPTERHKQEFFRLFGVVRASGRLATDPESLTSRYGRFSAQPFELGFGADIGNSLRRALLTGLEGAAITAVKIEGVADEFETIPGIVEDLTEIILNLQKIPFKLNAGESKTLKIFKDGPGELTSADIETDDDVEILDRTIHIATVSEGGPLKIEIRLKNGRGYVPAAENSEDLEIGYIPIDSEHGPVKEVNYTVEPARVDQEQYDKLSIEILTDGSVRPDDALAFAANLIMSHMSTFINFKEDRVRIVERTYFEPWLQHYNQHTTGYACQLVHVPFQPEEMSGVFLDKLSSTKDSLKTIREVIQEESTARNYVTKRYRELVDRKYLTGLSQTENEELDALTLTLEEMDKPYYEAIVDRLRDLIEQR